MKNNLKVYLLVGSPGSGKSTWRKDFISKNPNTKCVCPDEYRAIIGGNAANQAVSFQAFCACYDDMKQYLDQGKDVIVDATNMYRRTRKKFIQIAREKSASVVAMVFEVDKPTLLKRIAKRVSEGGMNVPENVVDNMLSKYQCPDTNEVDVVKFL